MQGTDLKDYFERIHYFGPCEPTLEVLKSLHALHPAAIPYEATDVLVGRGINISSDAIFNKLVREGRGGYCFEQNGLFQRVLQTLGFKVEAYLGRVLWGTHPDDPLLPRTHMSLKVSIAGQDWLADVGFGGAVMSAPIRFDYYDPQPTSGGVFRLTPLVGDLKLEIQSVDGWSPMVLITPTPQLPVDFISPNWFTSTHPESRFKNHLLVCRISPEARYALRDNRLTIRYSDGHMERYELDLDGLEVVLADRFGISVNEELRTAIRRVVPGSQTT